MDKERRNKSFDDGENEYLNQHHSQHSEKRTGLSFLKPDSTGERNMSGAWKIAAIALGIIGVILLVIGLCLYCTSTKTIGNAMDFDYTNCTDDSFAKHICNDRVKMNKTCFCLLNFELTEPIKGPTFLYYKTPDIRTSEHYKDSRDDQQLAGNLSPTPSASCEDFRMNAAGFPIAPCGEIADSYLEDTYNIYTQSDTKYIPSSNVSLRGITEEDKKQYRNPPGDLITAFKDFAKPTNWTINIWQLDEINPENNGFQNEKFIGWMKQDLILKPALRFIQTDKYKDGIPPGNYSFRIAYKPSKYVNQRIVIISSKREVVDEAHRSAGIALIVIGVILLVAFLFALGFIMFKRMRNVGY